MKPNTDVLIAHFMGVKQISTGIDPRFEFTDFKQQTIHQYGMDTWMEATDSFNRSELMFGTSWDWLMPVVHKISEMHDQLTYIVAGHIFEDIKCDLYDVNIIEVYKNVVKFIELYNRDDEQGEYFKEYKN